MLYYDEEDAFRVSSRLLKFSYNYSSAVGKIKLNFPRAEEYSWELLLGVNESPLKESYRYIPDTLPPGLLDWLESAVNAGKVEDSGLLFHGVFIPIFSLHS